MRDIRVGWRVTMPDGRDGTVVSIRPLPTGILVGVRPDDGGKIKHHYAGKLTAAKTGAPAKVE